MLQNAYLLAKIGADRVENERHFAEILQMSQNLQTVAKFQKFQLNNLVDFEKCCKTHINLQKSVPIQPKTSNILPKNCSSWKARPECARYRSRPQNKVPHRAPFAPTSTTARSDSYLKPPPLWNPPGTSGLEMRNAAEVKVGRSNEK